MQDRDHPVCPKCGYDQSGEIATWTESCPIAGTCPECGLDFVWADLLDPSRVDVRWYVEHARSRFSILKRTIPTLWYLLIPNRFWKRIRPDAEIRIGLLSLWSVGIIFTGYILSTILLLAASFLERYSWRGGTSSITELVTNFDTKRAYDILSDPSWFKDKSLEAARFPYDEISRWWTSYEFLSLDAARSCAFAIACTLMWGLILGVIPTTRSIAKIRFAHITRAIILGLVVSATWFYLVRSIDAINWMCKIIYPSSLVGDYIGPVLAWIILAYAALWPQLSMIFAIRKSWSIRPSRLLITVGLLGSVVCSSIFVALLLQLVRIMRYA